MIVLRVVLFLVGASIVAWAVMSAIRTVILPRNAQVAITRWVLRIVRIPFDMLAHEGRTFEVRDRVMALYAPITLVVLPAVWLVLVLLGYMLAIYALGDISMSEAFHLSGSSITTLGFAAAQNIPQEIMAFSEAGIGLFLVALMVTYLPSMYSAFSHRETEVALLAVRAGNPPSAVEFLARHHRIGWLEDLDDTWITWERWFAEIEESHTTYPMLAFFRSPRPNRSWVTAAGTVLDAGSMMLAAVPVGSKGPPGVAVRAGYLALRHIGEFFGIDFDTDPAPDDPISITRTEFDAACDALGAAGVPLTADRDQAWRDYKGWRVNYDAVLLSLAQITMAPVAPWTSDRSAIGYREPKIRRFGQRLRPEPGGSTAHDHDDPYNHPQATR